MALVASDMATQKRTKLTASRTEIERTRFGVEGRKSRTVPRGYPHRVPTAPRSPVFLRQTLGNRGVGAVRVALQIRLGNAPSTGAVARSLQRLHQSAPSLACEGTRRLFLKVLLKPAG